MAESRSVSRGNNPVSWMLLCSRWGRQIRRAMEAPRTFLISILAILVILSLWSAWAPVDQVVRVEGRIIPAGRAQQIQHLEGGIVATISTSEGRQVHKGDLLLTIDATSVGANLSETEVKLVSQRARAARLEAETAGSAEVRFPADVAKERAALDERQLFLTRRQRHDQELRVFEELFRQRQAEMAEVEGRKIRLAKELATAQQRSTLINGMASRNAASRLEVLEAESREQRLATELSDTETSLPKIRAGMAEARARAEDVRAQFRATAHEDLVASRAEIERLGKIVTAQEDRVSRTEVRAPVDGVINRVTANTVGGVVKPGEVIIELTPSAGEVLVEARARPSDRGELQPGQKTKVRVSAYDSAALGTLAGTVQEISADTVEDGRGEHFYRIAIRVGDLPATYRDRLLTPGMTATADIVTGRRTVLRHLLSPLTKFSDNAFRDPR